jgi:branched-chain amino acid transport system ATP-binding protein
VVLHDVSVALAQGQSMALLGRNGTGKTTFMNTLAGACTRRHGGTITVRRDRTCTRCRLHRARGRRSSAGCRRSATSSSRSRCDENLTAVARPAGPAVDAGRASTRCSRAWPSGEPTSATQLLGGEQQMLAVGRALVLNPKLLLLDEPLEGLAPDHRARNCSRAIAASRARRAWSAIIVERRPQAVLAIPDVAAVARPAVPSSTPARHNRCASSPKLLEPLRWGQAR